MDLQKFTKKVLIILASLLCVCVTCCGCTGILLNHILPEDPGNRDWRVVLDNGYEILHVNSKQILLTKQGWSHNTNIVVDSHITAFCHNDLYIGLQCDGSEDAVQSEYFLVNMEENQLFGPFLEDEFYDFCKAEEIAGFDEWINTSPAPDCATYH